MSHFSTVKTELRDLPALIGALSDLGHDPSSSRPVRGYQGQTVMADVVVAQPQGADIGFRWNPANDCYELVTDLQLWKQPVPVERFLANLHQRYALRTILAATADEGFQVREQRNSLDGSIELVVTRWDG
jgi:hypothetical protein